MAKKKHLPKKIAGYKVPKAIRKNRLIRTLLASDTGRDLLAKALIAGAAAAATVVAGEKEEISTAASSGKRQGAKAVGVVGDAFHRGMDAAFDVIREAAGSAIPKKLRKSEGENPRKGVAIH